MSNRILDGVKVADFSWVGVGPVTARELAFHGATVVRVESHRRPDGMRLTMPFKDGIAGIDRSAAFATCNTNKLGMSLDLSQPRGQEVGRRLALWADVVTDGMVPGTMKRWGLDYETLSKDKPSLIYFSTTQQGQYGPYASYGGYGALGAAIAGYSHLIGSADREPLPVFNQYTDWVSPWFLVLAIASGLRRVRRTGRGLYLDQAQIEAGLNLLGPASLDFQVNGRVATRDGNRDPEQAPHGVYPCAGQDRWVAIAVGTEEQWQAFVQVMGSPAWAIDGRFGTFPDRKANEDELDRRVAEWTATRGADEVMSLLQGAGVPAGVVRSGEDLFSDDQLTHRQHFRWLEHPVIGRHAYHSPAYRMSETPAQLTSPGPCLGQHNEHVYQEILGYSEEEMADLLIEGVITT